MGRFDSVKRKVEKPTWKVYLDMIENKKMSVRVDMQYVNKNYKNTFYIQVKYSDYETDNLPDKNFLDDLAIFEEKVLEIVRKTFDNNVVFLGTATFGGSSYITFASDLDIRWRDFINSMVDKNIIAGVYQNDNMGYYNKVLYPDFMR